MEKDVYLKRSDYAPYMQLGDMVVTVGINKTVAVYSSEEFEFLKKNIMNNFSRNQRAQLLRFYIGKAVEITRTEEISDIYIPPFLCELAGFEVGDTIFIWTIGTGEKFFLSKTEDGMLESVKFQQMLHTKLESGVNDTLRFTTCILY